MALARPKTLSQAKATYNTNSELAWWVFMRISGLALLILTFGHLFMNNILINAGNIDYAFVSGRLSNPLIKIYDTFLLGLAILHGYNGLRYSIEDYTALPSRRFWFKIAIYVIASVVFIFGIIALWAADFAPIDAASGSHS